MMTANEQIDMTGLEFTLLTKILINLTHSSWTNQFIFILRKHYFYGN